MTEFTNAYSTSVEELSRGQGSQRRVDRLAEMIGDKKRTIEQNSTLMGEFELKRVDITSLEASDTRYNSIADVTRELLENKLTEGASNYFSRAVDSATEFVQNMNTGITDDVELFEEIKRYCKVRENVTKYIDIGYSTESNAFIKSVFNQKENLKLLKKAKYYTCLASVILVRSYEKAFNDKYINGDDLKCIPDKVNFNDEVANPRIAALQGILTDAYREYMETERTK